MRSLARGLAALDVMIGCDRPWRTTELANRLGVDKSVASRLLRSLVEAGYAIRGGDRRYRLGPKLARLQAPPDRIPPDLRQRARPLLSTLVEETGECAHLAVLVGEQAFYLDKVESPAPLRVDHPVGLLTPLHCTALGKVLLAFAGAPMPVSLPRYTPNTLGDADALRAELELTKDRGFAVDDEEFSTGIRCVATALRDGQDRAIAAIGVSGPTARMDGERIQAVGQAMVAAASKFNTSVNTDIGEANT